MVRDACSVNVAESKLIRILKIDVLLIQSEREMTFVVLQYIPCIRYDILLKMNCTVILNSIIPIIWFEWNLVLIVRTAKASKLIKTKRVQVWYGQ